MVASREKLLRFAEQKKVFRPIEVERELGIPRTYIQRLVEEGKLLKVGYGLYGLPDSGLTEYQSYIEVAAKVPNGVLCLLTALVFHQLTTQNPFEVWLAIPRNSRTPKIETVQTRIFRFSESVYTPGIETHEIEGVTVKAYSPAKTIADCFYYRKTVGLDVAIEALTDAWQQKKATMDELYHYSKIRNVRNTMLPYLNTLS